MHRRMPRPWVSPTKQLYFTFRALSSSNRDRLSRASSGILKPVAGYDILGKEYSWTRNWKKNTNLLLIWSSSRLLFRFSLLLLGCGVAGLVFLCFQQITLIHDSFFASAFRFVKPNFYCCTHSVSLPLSLTHTLWIQWKRRAKERNMTKSRRNPSSSCLIMYKNTYSS